MNKTERDKLARYVSGMINSPTSTTSEVDRGRMMLEDFNIKVEYTSYEHVDLVDNAVKRITAALRDRACGQHAFAITAIQVDSVKQLMRKFLATNLDRDDKIWYIISDYQDAKGWSNAELDRWLNQSTYNLNDCMAELITDPQWIDSVMEHLGTGIERDIERRGLLLGELDLESKITQLLENR